MNGLLIAVSDFPEGGATTARVTSLCKAVQAGGLNIQLILMHASTKNINDIPSSGNYEGVEYVFANNSSSRPAGFLGKLKDTVKGVLNTLIMIYNNRNNIDFIIFYTPNFYKNIASMLLAKILGIHVIIEACEILSLTTSGGAKRKLSRVANSGDYLMEMFACRIADCLIVISTGIRKYYESLSVKHECIYLLPILVDVGYYGETSNYKVHDLKGKKYILNSGSFSEKDGIPYVLEAFNKLASEISDVYLVFTGNASDSVKKDMINTINENYRNRIIFTGFLKRVELIWAYQNAIALLSCRTNSKFSQYGFSTKIGEYLSTSIPVIATDVGDIALYLEHKNSVYLAKPKNPNSIADCMLDIMSDRSTAKKIGVNGRFVAKKYFNIDGVAPGLSEFIVDCLHKSSKSS